MECCSLKQWYVFYTYPKFEKKVHECLIKENYESFLPMHWVIRQWSDRKKKLYVPLFPNYIFVNTKYVQIFEILKNPRVISCVKFNKQPAFLKQKEVDCIKEIVETDYNFEVISNLGVGDSIIINDGPLIGMKGVLTEERGSHRFAVQIDSLQQSVIVDVPSSCIEILDAVAY